MIYFRVKPEYDNKRVYYMCDDHGHFVDDILIANELYTPSELSRLRDVSLDCFELIDVREEDTYFFFGAKFESRKGR